MKKVKIDFDFSKWGQDGISVEFKGGPIQTLHQHPNPHAGECFYGIDGFGQVFKKYLSEHDLTMYQEIKPREIWVNEYPAWLGGCHDTKQIAENNKSRDCIRTIKFREVQDDEQ